MENCERAKPTNISKTITNTVLNMGNTTINWLYIIEHLDFVNIHRVYPDRYP